MVFKFAYNIYLAIFICVAASIGVSADSRLSQFSEYSSIRQFDINYTDWSAILDHSVIDAGMSDRDFAPRVVPGTGRHFYRGNTSSLRYEGNRLYFINFRDENNFRDLQLIRQGLETMPDDVPMREWTKNQQLAYWLNLYNVTLVEQLAAEYPVTNIRRMLYGRNGILSKKLLMVEGVRLSLNDIHHKILIPNWQDPLVMYGLFHGYVGGPSIQPKAFTADNVYEALRHSATEFINSNRGMVRDGEGLKVSELYKINKALFPAGEADLRAHLEKYASADYVPAIRGASRIRAKTNDYYVADLFEGVLYDNNPNIGSSAALTAGSAASWVADAADRADRIMGRSMPMTALNYITRLQYKRSKHKGTVSVEEVEDKASPEPED